MSLCFQLEARSPHEGFVFFDNGRRGAGRICVVVTIRKLSPEENAIAKAVILHRGGTAALCHQREAPEDVALEFIRYVVVHLGDDPPRAWDLDTLREVATESERALVEGRAPPLESFADRDRVLDEPEAYVSAAASPVAPPQRPVRQRTLEFTAEGQTVALVLGRYTDPNVRTAIRMRVRGDPPVRPDTAYGASVKAVNPKHLRVKRFTRRPPCAPPLRWTSLTGTPSTSPPRSRGPTARRPRCCSRRGRSGRFSAARIKMDRS